MIWLAFLFIVLVLILANALIRQLNRPNNYPPGPKWLPIVGNTLLLEKLSRKLGGQHLAFSHLASEYKTNVLGLKLGSRYVVVALSKEVVQEVFLKDDLQERPSNFFIKVRSMFTNKGITMTNGKLWYEQKNFALRHLRQLGFVKNTMENLIIDELEETIKHHKETLKERDKDDFIYSFLEEMEAQKQHTSSTFTDDQLLMVCMDFFIAGAETTSNTLAFALLSMILNPTIQDKVHFEIKNILGPRKIPALGDRIK